MRIQAFSEPCILLETVELLFAAINQIPASKLTASGPYCIPEAEIQRILNEVRGEFDLQDQDFPFFFQKTQIKDGSGDTTCLARNISYLRMCFHCADLSGAMETLRTTWREFLDAREYPVRIGKYSLDCTKSDDGQESTLEKKISGLPVSIIYQRKLLEAFTDLEASTKRLEKLILPVTEYVEQELAPWKEQARPLVGQWQEEFSRPEFLENMKKHWPQEMARGAVSIRYALRYFEAQYRVSGYDNVENCVYFHIGVGGAPHIRQKKGFESWELRALRLLGNVVRAQILSTVRDKPMSTREIARELQLDLGTVSRDVRNLCDAGILAVRENENRRRYTVRVETLEALIGYLESLRPEQ